MVKVNALLAPDLGARITREVDAESQSVFVYIEGCRATVLVIFFRVLETAYIHVEVSNGLIAKVNSLVEPDLRLGC